MESGEVEGGLRPPSFIVTPGQWGEALKLIPVLEQIRVPRPAGGRPRPRPDHRAVATRYDKRVYIFHGTVTGASIRLWPRW